MNFNVTPTPSKPARRRGGLLPKIGFLAAVLLIGLVVVLVIVPPFVTVPTGHTGVVTTFGKVANYTLDEGFHLKNPLQRVTVMDNRTQKRSITMQAFSQDIQQVDVVTSVIYSVDRETVQDLYKNVGVSYYDTVMMPRILENVKAVFTKYSAERLMEVRDSISVEVKQLLSPEMKKYGIEIVSVSIEDVDFTDAFTDAVESKQVAEQTKLQVETEQSQQVSVERSTAERRIIAAKADAEERELLAQADAAVVKIHADAEAYSVEVQAKAEAEANLKIAASITDRLINYRQVSQWDGKLPEIYAGEGALPILDLNGQQALTE